MEEAEALTESNPSFYPLAACAEHPGEIEYPDSGCAKCREELSDLPRGAGRMSGIAKTAAVTAFLGIWIAFALILLTGQKASGNTDWGRKAISYARQDPDLQESIPLGLAVRKVSHSSADIVTVYLTARFKGDSHLELLEVVFHDGTADDISQISCGRSDDRCNP